MTQLKQTLDAPDTLMFRSAAGDFLSPLDSPPRSFETAADQQARVAILLCTYHGQDYLAEQLESYAVQQHRNWVVYASDDGSRDDTCSILERFQRRWGMQRLSIRRGPSAGFAANFLSLTCARDVTADYYAYSDQDDIWAPDKLRRALQLLASVSPEVPALYCSRTELVDAQNNSIGTSPLFSKPPGFANALMQNLGGGNTMVFNQAARELLCQAGADVEVVTHDWWAYLVVSGCGGRVFYDSRPSLRYRQHGGNLVGTNSSWAARLVRMRMLMEGHFRNWNDRNLRALQRLEDRLTPDNREILQRFSAAREQPLTARLRGLKESGVYRQTLLGNLGLLAAAIFNKL